MKTKLTITVDEDLIPEAKRYARAQGSSLSQVIESALREMTAQTRPTFSQRWQGRFEPSDQEDARYRALAEKYLS